jgi:hypothetical protein
MNPRDAGVRLHLGGFQVGQQMTLYGTQAVQFVNGQLNMRAVTLV